ncbi:BTAD domain-containing putative transcriptional regulator [Kitasatospora sp. NPDC056651]|uniref:AfsR/SARP family transcriptional regulator n=1 Tax=Kitasatospora sp. NPDC056651 TaxID=3345892 RepID=UPI003675AE9B
MRYSILGKPHVLHGDEPVFVSARKKEIVLASLLARANHVVSLEELISEIWGGNSPLRATTAVHVRICELRKLLRSCGMAESPIVTRSPGYFIHVEPGELDVHVFSRLAEEGRAAARAGAHHEAVEKLRSALELSQETTLGGLRSGPIINGFVNWLDQARLDCTEQWMESELTLGRHREAVGRLYALFGQHPLHEAFHRQLILALYRCDRRADALHVYQVARGVLRSELGLEPCLATRRVHHAILTADDHLYARASA